MILVDTSVWIAHLRGLQTQATAKLEAAAAQEPLLVGDLILLEVLQGARDEAHAARVERGLRQYVIVPLLGPTSRLESLGITARCEIWALRFARLQTSSSAHSASSTTIGCCMTTEIFRSWSSILD
jgi:hypothetical protein